MSFKNNLKIYRKISSFYHVVNKCDYYPEAYHYNFLALSNQWVSDGLPYELYPKPLCYSITDLLWIVWNMVLELETLSLGYPLMVQLLFS